MRKLSNKQKKILNKWSSYNHWDELPGDVRLKLSGINDYETLWSDASRYLGDMR